MVYGKDGVEHIYGTDIHEGLHAVGVECQVLVAEHDGLGRSCCSGCEEEGGKVFADRLPDWLRTRIRQVQDVVLFMPAFLQAYPETVLAVGSDSLEAVGIHEDALDLHIVHQMLDLGVGECGINRNNHGAHVDYAHVGYGPLGAVLSRYGHPVALPDAFGIQPSGDLVELDSGLGISERDMFGSERLITSVVREPCGHDVEHLRQRRPL